MSGLAFRGKAARAQAQGVDPDVGQGCRIHFRECDRVRVYARVEIVHGRGCTFRNPLAICERAKPREAWYDAAFAQPCRRPPSISTSGIAASDTMVYMPKAFK
jgi:hypothetical protein